MTGLVLIAAIAGLLVTTLARQSRAAARLADERACVRQAEAALASMSGRPPTTLPADITTRRLDHVAGSGWAWYEVGAGVGARRVTLVGLARADDAGRAR